MEISIDATPTLAPRRAYSQDVVGKWTQIVRQNNVEEDENKPPKQDLGSKLLSLSKQMKQSRVEPENVNEPPPVDVVEKPAKQDMNRLFALSKPMKSRSHSELIEVAEEM